IYNFFDGALIVRNSTITANTTFIGGGGIENRDDSTLHLRNTILAGNNRGPNPSDLSGSLTSSGHNLIGDTSDGSGFDATDLLDVNPLLGPLQDNGGPTFTHALLPGSPALDAGDNTGAPETDQRGLPRIVAGRIDIGAFEEQTPPVTVLGVVVNDGSAQRSMVTSITVTFTGTVTIDDGAFEVVNPEGSAVGLNFETFVVGERSFVLLTFLGDDIVPASVADGNYTLTIRGDLIRDNLGRRLDADGDGTPGGNRADAFFRLYGDGDGDRDVDLLDVVSFFGTFGRVADDPEFRWFFDFDGDGAVDTTALLALADRYGTQLNP